MFIEELLKEYKKRFGFKNVFIRNVRTNKWIILYLSFSLLFPIIIGYLFSLHLLIWMITTMVIYLFILFIGGMQHKARMLNSKPKNTLAFDLQAFRIMLKDIFRIETEEQLLRLDEIIRKEMEIKEHNRKYPLSEVIRQFTVAIFITGLLSYAFFEIRDGNKEAGSSYLSLYIFILAILITISGILKQFKEFGANSYLYEISYKIHLALLDDSINSNTDKGNEVTITKSDIISRKIRHK
ncbi:hypothetical protein [Niallia taxi]|uniref:hypothetical protein n=1 Tax=Niallia taxi TaxID=2499688 RepID=UPI002E1FC567|nr:hypothetical protein [Niallia taxi]